MSPLARMQTNKALALGVWGALNSSSWALLIGRRVRVTYGEHGQATTTGVLTLVADQFVVLDDRRQLFPVTLELDEDAA